MHPAAIHPRAFLIVAGYSVVDEADADARRSCLQDSVPVAAPKIRRCAPIRSAIARSARAESLRRGIQPERQPPNRATAGRAEDPCFPRVVRARRLR
jgi:hypothetical protein